MLHASFIDPKQNVIYLDSGLVSKDQLKESFPAGETFVDRIISFSEKLNAFQLTQGEVALLSALILTHGTSSLVCPVCVVTSFESGGVGDQ